MVHIIDPLLFRNVRNCFVRIVCVTILLLLYLHASNSVVKGLMSSRWRYVKKCQPGTNGKAKPTGSKSDGPQNSSTNG